MHAMLEDASIEFRTKGNETNSCSAATYFHSLDISSIVDDRGVVMIKSKKSRIEDVSSCKTISFIVNNLARRFAPSCGS